MQLCRNGKSSKMETQITSEVLQAAIAADESTVPRASYDCATSASRRSHQFLQQSSRVEPVQIVCSKVLSHIHASLITSM